MRRSKIFGIGLSKTGTSSLTEALEVLGFSAVHNPTRIEEIEIYDVAADLLVADTFEMLDVMFPGSKFVYTVRERTRWLESCRRHWRKKGEIDNTRRELRRRLYGIIDFNPDLFAQAYDRHESRVLSYFMERPDDLLVLDICGGGAGWEVLCPFLGMPVPNISFPNANRIDALEGILLRLLYVIGSVKQVAKIAKVSTQYVEDLYNSEAFLKHNSEIPLRCDGNRRIDRALDHACSHFGGISSAATKLKLPRDYLENARARHRRRKKARIFKELKLKLWWLVRRTSVGQLGMPEARETLKP